MVRGHFMPVLCTLCLAIALVMVFADDIDAADSGGRPVNAKVTRLVDGDTIEVVVRVRIRNIDAPEIASSEPCQRELSFQSRAKLLEIIPLGSMVRLSGLGQEPYGRLLAHVEFNDRDVGRALIGTGLARTWIPGRHGKGWCG